LAPPVAANGIAEIATGFLNTPTSAIGYPKIYWLNHRCCVVLVGMSKQTS